MKIPKVNDIAICRGHFNIYGEFKVIEVLKEKDELLGIKCKGKYTDYGTGKTTEEENFVRWSKKHKIWRI